MTVKLRVLKAMVINGGSATGLQAELEEFYLSLSDSNAQLLSMIRVADWAVLITYTE